MLLAVAVDILPVTSSTGGYPLVDVTFVGVCINEPDDAAVVVCELFTYEYPLGAPEVFNVHEAGVGVLVLLAAVQPEGNAGEADVPKLKLPDGSNVPIAKSGSTVTSVTVLLIVCEQLVDTLVANTLYIYEPAVVEDSVGKLTVLPALPVWKVPEALKLDPSHRLSEYCTPLSTLANCTLVVTLVVAVPLHIGLACKVGVISLGEGLILIVAIFEYFGELHAAPPEEDTTARY
jgi:hypothetical protein